jgi:hypothetical protein
MSTNARLKDLVLAVELSGIKVAGLGTQRDLGVTLEVRGGMHIIMGTDP